MQTPHDEGHPQKHEFGLALLLLGINAMNLADLAFTFLALRAGYPEGNPVMEALFLAFNVRIAGLIKLGIGVVFTGVAWVLRERRGMPVLVVVIFCVYWVLFFFHLYVTLRMI